MATYVETAQYIAGHLREEEAYFAAKISLSDLMNHQIDPSKVPEVISKGDREKFPEALKTAPFLSTPANPAATAIASMAAAAQLGGVRAAVAAMQSMMRMGRGCPAPSWATTRSRARASTYG
jgi:hypothetical protein